MIPLGRRVAAFFGYFLTVLKWAAKKWWNHWGGVAIASGVAGIVSLAIGAAFHGQIITYWPNLRQSAGVPMGEGILFLCYVAIPSAIVGLVVFAFYCIVAPSQIHMEQADRLAVMAAESAAHLQGHSEVRERIGAFISESQSLRVLCKTKKVDEVAPIVQVWIETCRRYLLDNLDGSYAVRFRDFTGLSRFTERLSDPSCSIWFDQVYFGSIRLTEFLKEPLPATVRSDASDEQRVELERQLAVAHEQLKARLTEGASDGRSADLERQLGEARSRITSLEASGGTRLDITRRRLGEQAKYGRDVNTNVRMRSWMSATEHLVKGLLKREAARKLHRGYPSGMGRERELNDTDLASREKTMASLRVLEGTITEADLI